VGSLVDKHYSIIMNCSTDTVVGNRYVGGIAGLSYGLIVASYSTGTVIGNEDVGGLAGGYFYDSINKNFWDIRVQARPQVSGVQARQRLRFRTLRCTSMPIGILSMRSAMEPVTTGRYGQAIILGCSKDHKKSLTHFIPNVTVFRSKKCHNLYG
jgi:hypothetical protein